MTITITLTGFSDDPEIVGPIEMGNVILPTSAGIEDAQRLLQGLVSDALPPLHEYLTPGKPEEPVDPGTPPEEEDAPVSKSKAKASA